MSPNSSGVTGRDIPSSLRRILIHAISDAVSGSDMYSASVELLETVCCFLEDHEMRFWPINVHNPPVDRLVAGQPAQSLSL